MHCQSYFPQNRHQKMANLPPLLSSLPHFQPINYSTLNDDINALRPHEVFPQIPSVNDATAADLSPSCVQLQQDSHQPAHPQA